MKKIKKPKIGDVIFFNFAGTVESGEILRIEDVGKLSRYIVSDGKYKYPVSLESIISKIDK